MNYFPATSNQESSSALLRACLSQVFRRDDLTLAVSTGTPSPFRKSTLMVMDSYSSVLGFAKIGETMLAKRRLKTEALMLENLRPLLPPNVFIPALLYAGDLGDAYIIIQSPAPLKGMSGRAFLNESYVSVVKSLVKLGCQQTLESSAFCVKIREGVENHPVTHREIMEKGFDHFYHNYANYNTEFGVMHGDFTPWNMLWYGDKVFLYDWESSCMNAPAGIDLMHFLFQAGFLLKKLRKDKLLAYVKQWLSHPFLLSHLSGKLLPDAALMNAYCLYMAVTEDREDLWGGAAFQRRWILNSLTNN